MKTNKVTDQKTTEEVIAEDGLYFFKKETGIWIYRLLLIIDLIVFGLIYAFVAIGLALFLNDVTTKKLDRKQSKGIIFMEIVLAVGSIIFALIIGLLIIGFLQRHLTIVKLPPLAHRVYKSWGGAAIMIFIIVSLQVNLTEKMRYVFNEDEDKKNRDLKEIHRLFENCKLPFNTHAINPRHCKLP